MQQKLIYFVMYLDDKAQYVVAAKNKSEAESGFRQSMLGVLTFKTVRAVEATEAPIDDFMRDLGSNRVPRVPGTAIFMSRSRTGIPTTLLHNLKHNKVVHQTVVLLNVDVEEIARVPEEQRYDWHELGNGVFRLVVHVGFIEDPNLPELLGKVKGPVSFPPMTTSYFLGRETLIATRAPGMAIWREQLFTWMMRNASSASQYFCLPPNQIIELGAQIEM